MAAARHPIFHDLLPLNHNLLPLLKSTLVHIAIATQSSPCSQRPSPSSTQVMTTEFTDFLDLLIEFLNSEVTPTFMRFFYGDIENQTLINATFEAVGSADFFVALQRGCAGNESKYRQICRQFISSFDSLTLIIHANAPQNFSSVASLIPHSGGAYQKDPQDPSRIDPRILSKNRLMAEWKFCQWTFREGDVDVEEWYRAVWLPILVFADCVYQCLGNLSKSSSSKYSWARVGFNNSDSELFVDPPYLEFMKAMGVFSTLVNCLLNKPEETIDVTFENNGTRKVGRINNNDRISLETMQKIVAPVVRLIYVTLSKALMDFLAPTSEPATAVEDTLKFQVFQELAEFINPPPWSSNVSIPMPLTPSQYLKSQLKPLLILEDLYPPKIFKASQTPSTLSKLLLTRLNENHYFYSNLITTKENPNEMDPQYYSDPWLPSLLQSQTLRCYSMGSATVEHVVPQEFLLRYQRPDTDSKTEKRKGTAGDDKTKVEVVADAKDQNEVQDFVTQDSKTYFYERPSHTPSRKWRFTAWRKAQKERKRRAMESWKSCWPQLDFNPIFTHKFGNLTLLSSSLNSMADFESWTGISDPFLPIHPPSSPFQLAYTLKPKSGGKRFLYLFGSSFAMTKNLGLNSSWTVKQFIGLRIDHLNRIDSELGIGINVHEDCPFISSVGGGMNTHRADIQVPAWISDSALNTKLWNLCRSAIESYALDGLAELNRWDLTYQNGKPAASVTPPISQETAFKADQAGPDESNHEWQDVEATSEDWEQWIIQEEVKITGSSHKKKQKVEE